MRETDEKLVGEPVEPVRGAFDVSMMATAAPGLPGQFTWRGDRYTVASVIKSWKSTGPCRCGSDEQYVRKHWFTIRTTCGIIMTLYFERQPRSARERKTRWWLHSIVAAD